MQLCTKLQMIKKILLCLQDAGCSCPWGCCRHYSKLQVTVLTNFLPNLLLLGTSPKCSIISSACLALNTRNLAPCHGLGCCCERGQVAFIGSLPGSAEACHTLSKQGLACSSVLLLRMFFRLLGKPTCGAIRVHAQSLLLSEWQTSCCSALGCTSFERRDSDQHDKWSAGTVLERRGQASSHASGIWAQPLMACRLTEVSFP